MTTPDSDEARGRIEEMFPGLRGLAWSITSERDTGYNCIAWANGRDDDPWEPGLGYWPKELPRDTKPATMKAMFERQGFAFCQDRAHEDGVEKVAIYIGARDFGFTHVARQAPGGTWRSKLGTWEDIEHPTLESLEGEAYGQALIVMRREQR